MKRLSRRSIFLGSMALSAVLEAITAILRFGFGLRSTADTASTIGVLTFGLRIHHGYIGALVFAAVPLLRRRPDLRSWALLVGIALVASDLAHHLLVLWPIVGSPEFDLFYP